LIADLEECRLLGVPVLTGDATDPVMLKRARVNRAEHLIAVSGDNGVNAEIALQVATVATRKNHHLTCYVNVDDQELSLLLDETARFDAIHLSASSGATIVYRFFNILQQGPETLLREREYLLHPGDGVDPSLLVVGGGPIAIGLVVEAARQWQKTSTTSVKLRITVADTDAEALVQGVHQRSKDLHMVCDLAVSYTHLDVYKRQLRTFPASPRAALARPEQGGTCGHTGSHGRGPGRSTKDGGRR